jgi:hypothetical protein
MDAADKAMILVLKSIWNQAASVLKRLRARPHRDRSVWKRAVCGYTTIAFKLYSAS